MEIDNPKIDISLINGHKTIVLIFTSKNRANDCYDVLPQHTFIQYKHLGIPTIIIHYPENNALRIELRSIISNYPNINWLLENELEYISTGYYQEMALQSNPPILINYRVLPM